MKRVFSLAMMLIASLVVFAQQPEVQPAVPDFFTRYSDFNFNGKFAAAIRADGTNNYFLLDFSVFSSRFERVWFMNESFSHENIVNIDPDIKKNQVWFMANIKYPVNEILKIFDELKKKVADTDSSWTESMKSEWFTANDKYK